MGISGGTSRVALAAGTPVASTDTALPAPPPPASAAPDGPLPPPPPPRSSTVPPQAATGESTALTPIAPPPGAPGSDLPPLPPLPRGARLHDGFYLRLGVGLGLGGALVSSDSKSVGDYSFGGGAGAFDVWLGGTPIPGLAMGAALSGLGLGSTERSVDGNRVSGDVSGSMGLLGYFVDVFPDPVRGLHFGGALGLASARAEVKDSGRKFEGGGFGLQAWGGYDFWVSPQWSLGGMLRFIGSVTREDDAGVAYRTSLGAVTLCFTALYH
ncbi:MAG TPA: hypothetical protein VER11_02745 [Polyangiaceae bacterium]|nr:hypothetical protein [Polyangiaceae bacterium]